MAYSYSSSSYSSSSSDDDDYTTPNSCSICGRHFQNQNNLRMHARSHARRDQECYGCTRPFSCFSAMLIHLESGACSGGADRERIKALAFTCFQFKKYTRDRDDYYPFYCYCCGTSFRFLSGLYQHVETRPGCEWLLEDRNCLERLEWFIRWRV